MLIPSPVTLWHTLVLTLVTITIYQSFAIVQKKLNKLWFNPMILTIMTLIPALLFFDLSFENYFASTKILTYLVEPAVVALGFPLYQHINSIKHQWQSIVSLLLLGVVLVIMVSFILTVIFIAIPEIAVSLALKSVTTPIGISLTEQLHGDSSITAFAIILAGLFGALLGPSWLNFIHVRSAKAQGLAIGAASHALGTAAISKISYEHGAYSSLALIISAVITAIIGPVLITNLATFLA